MTEEFESNPAQATQAALSMGLSAMNGIFALVGALAGRGLLSKDNIDFLHSSMLAPLTNEGGNIEMMALQMRRIDELCAVVVSVIEGKDTDPE